MVQQFDAVNEKKNTIQYVGRSASSCLVTSYRSPGLAEVIHDKSHPESGPSLPCNNNNQTEISVSCIICNQRLEHIAPTNPG